MPALTLGALADLQAFAREHSWDPFDVPEVDRPDLMLALVIVEADGWPPELGTELAERAIAGDAYLDEFSYVAVGRPNGLGRAESAALGRLLRADDAAWFRTQCAAYGERPEDLASRVLNAIEGGVPAPRGEPVDWPLAIIDLVRGAEGRRGMTFAEAEALSLPQFRLWSRAYRDRQGYLRLTPERTCPPAPRPGETSREAGRRRAALCDEARAILEARYAGG